MAIPESTTAPPQSSKTIEPSEKTVLKQTVSSVNSNGHSSTNTHSNDSNDSNGNLGVYNFIFLTQSIILAS